MASEPKPMLNGHECFGRMSQDLPWIRILWVEWAARWWAPAHDCWIWPVELTGGV